VVKKHKNYYIYGGDEAFDNARKEALDMAIEALRCKPCDDAVSRDLMTNTLGATCIAKRDEKGDLVALCSIDNLPSATPKPKTIDKYVEDVCGYALSKCQRDFITAIYEYYKANPFSKVAPCFLGNSMINMMPFLDVVFAAYEENELY